MKEHEMTMEQRCYEDNVIFDMPAEEILWYLLDEGKSLNQAIDIVERTQNITITINH